MKALYGESPSFETLLEVFRSLVQTVGEESVRVGSNEHAIQTWAAIADEGTAAERECSGVEDLFLDVNVGNCQALFETSAR